MGAVGIVAEYNPLHNGHIYHLEQAKKETGADFCVIAMSGNFVQRGEPACADKFTRAEWALRAGADLIVEIPQCLAVASAERFAEGAVKLLAETGVVTDIAFGVETDNLDGLYRIADILDREPPAFRTNLAYHLKQGKSYPRAQFDALSDLNIPRGDVALLTQPNNILAVEYIKAIRRFAPHIRAVPILRQGNGYNDAELTGPLSSATAIRQALREGNEAVLDTMPVNWMSGGRLSHADSGPTDAVGLGGKVDFWGVMPEKLETCMPHHLCQVVAPHSLEERQLQQGVIHVEVGGVHQLSTILSRRDGEYHTS